MQRLGFRSRGDRAHFLRMTEKRQTQPRPWHHGAPKALTISSMILQSVLVPDQTHVLGKPLPKATTQYARKQKKPRNSQLAARCLCPPPPPTPSPCQIRRSITALLSQSDNATTRAQKIHRFLERKGMIAFAKKRLYIQQPTDGEKPLLRSVMC